PRAVLWPASGAGHLARALEPRSPADRDLDWCRDRMAAAPGIPSGDDRVAPAQLRRGLGGRARGVDLAALRARRRAVQRARGAARAARAGRRAAAGAGLAGFGRPPAPPARGGDRVGRAHGGDLALARPRPLPAHVPERRRLLGDAREPARERDRGLAGALRARPRAPAGVGSGAGELLPDERARRAARLRARSAVRAARRHDGGLRAQRARGPAAGRPPALGARLPRLPGSRPGAGGRAAEGTRWTGPARRLVESASCGWGAC